MRREPEIFVKVLLEPKMLLGLFLFRFIIELLSTANLTCSFHLPLYLRQIFI